MNDKYLLKCPFSQVFAVWRLSTCPEKNMSFINISMMHGFTDWPGGSNTPWFQSGERPKWKHQIVSPWKHNYPSITWEARIMYDPCLVWCNYSLACRKECLFHPCYLQVCRKSLMFSRVQKHLRCLPIPTNWWRLNESTGTHSSPAHWVYLKVVASKDIKRPLFGISVEGPLY